MVVATNQQPEQRLGSMGGVGAARTGPSPTPLASPIVPSPSVCVRAWLTCSACPARRNRPGKRAHVLGAISGARVRLRSAVEAGGSLTSLETASVLVWTPPSSWPGLDEPFRPNRSFSLAVERKVLTRARPASTRVSRGMFQRWALAVFLLFASNASAQEAPPAASADSARGAPEPTQSRPRWPSGIGWGHERGVSPNIRDWFVLD